MPQLDDLISNQRKQLDDLVSNQSKLQMELIAAVKELTLSIQMLADTQSRIVCELIMKDRDNRDSSK